MGRLPHGSCRVILSSNFCHNFSYLLLSGASICCGQSPVAPIIGEKHLQKKSALIRVVSDGDPPMLKSVESNEQQINL